MSYKSLKRSYIWSLNALILTSILPILVETFESFRISLLSDTGHFPPMGHKIRRWPISLWEMRRHRYLHRAYDDKCEKIHIGTQISKRKINLSWANILCAKKRLWGSSHCNAQCARERLNFNHAMQNQKIFKKDWKLVLGGIFIEGYSVNLFLQSSPFWTPEQILLTPQRPLFSSGPKVEVSGGERTVSQCVKTIFLQEVFPPSRVLEMLSHLKTALPETALQQGGSWWWCINHLVAAAPLQRRGIQVRRGYAA